MNEKATNNLLTAIMMQDTQSMKRLIPLNTREDDNVIYKYIKKIAALAQCEGDEYHPLLLMMIENQRKFLKKTVDGVNSKAELMLIEDIQEDIPKTFEESVLQKELLKFVRKPFAVCIQATFANFQFISIFQLTVQHEREHLSQQIIENNPKKVDLMVQQIKELPKNDFTAKALILCEQQKLHNRVAIGKHKGKAFKV